MNVTAIAGALARSGAPLDATQIDVLKAAAKTQPELVFAAVTLSEQPQVACALTDVQKPWEAMHPIERLCIMHSEDEKVEARIDAWLEGTYAYEVVAALARARVVWTHDVLTSMLSQPKRCRDAATLLSVADPDALLHFMFESGEVKEDVFYELLHVFSFLEPANAHDPLMAAHDDILEDEETRATKRTRARLEGIIALANPTQYARLLLADACEDRWLRVGELVADVLMCYGGSSWLETLALLEVGESMTAFEFAATLAVAAAFDTSGAHAQGAVDEEECRSLLLQVQEKKEGWDAAALHANLPLSLSMGDEDLVALLIESTLHERLLFYESASPGISGLPLSSNVVDGLDLDATLSLFESLCVHTAPADEMIVAGVRTLCDARLWMMRAPEAMHLLFDSDLIERLCDHPNAALNLAARRTRSDLHPIMGDTQAQSVRDVLILGAKASGACDLLVEAALKTNVLGLLATLEVLELERDEALVALTTIWASCDTLRVDAVRGALMEWFERYGQDDDASLP